VINANISRMEAYYTGGAPADKKKAENHIADLPEASGERCNSNRREENRPPFAYGNTQAPEQEEYPGSTEEK